MNPPAPLATVIVAYLSGDHLPACLRAAPQPAVVIDNSPPAENLGFAGGVNRGFVLSKAPFVLILNPDCLLLTGVDAMLAEFAHPRVGAVGGRLVDATERTQTGFTVRRFPTALTLSFEVLGLNRLFPGNPVNRRYRCLDLDLERTQCVEQPAGAFLMVRREAFDQVGGFDEAFHPVWFEDVDFCKRLRAEGWEVRYTPEAIAQHAGGHSVGRLDPTSKTVAWYGSLLRYSAKHFPRPGRWLLAVSMVVSALPRGIFGAFRDGDASPVGAHVRVAWLAIKRLIIEDFES